MSKDKHFQMYNTQEEIIEAAKDLEGHWFVSNFAIWAKAANLVEALAHVHKETILSETNYALTNVCFVPIKYDVPYHIDFYLPKLFNDEDHPEWEDLIVFVLQEQQEYK